MPGAGRPNLGGAASWREQAAKWRADDPIDAPAVGRSGSPLAMLGSWLGRAEDQGPACEEETQRLLGLAQGGLQSVAEKAGGAIGLGTAMQAATIGRQQWINFAVLLLLGLLLMSISTASFPLIVLAPHKFAGMFTTGSLCILGSFAALRGFGNFAVHLTSPERLPFSAAYLGSMVGTIWASLWARSALLTIVFSAVQISQLLWFFVSYIPGGSSVLGFVCDALKQACCGCCCRKGGSVPL
mmetsp:Transcript_67616/g.213960  ORF Transcript_67616/g.213960 Transcript_67616/m.213960 type:complete len:241 (+) Transcript_67616:57-779(+)